MIWRMLGLAFATLALCTGARAQSSMDPQPVAQICARGAQWDTLPLADLLALEARRYENAVYSRVVANAEGSNVSTDGQLWGDVMAAETADLPPSARDLPILILLAGLENGSDPVHMLMYAPQSQVMPEILAALDRQGLTSQAAALRQMMAAFPDWDQGFDSRIAALSDYEATGKAIYQTVEAAAQAYVVGDVEQAAIALIAQHATLRQTILDRAAQMDDDALLSLVLEKLWADCAIDWDSAQGLEASLARLGAPQAAILMLDTLLMETMDGTAEYYFLGVSGTVAPQVIRVLEIRGLWAHADGARTAMAMFSDPFPRDIYMREAEYGRFTDDQVAQLAALSGLFQDEVIWAEMKLIARDSGLMPGVGRQAPLRP